MSRERRVRKRDIFLRVTLASPFEGNNTCSGMLAHSVAEALPMFACVGPGRLYVIGRI